MSTYDDLAQQLRTRLHDLLARTEVIEADLRQPLDADWEDQAIDLADDEALEGVDEVLRSEIAQIRLALLRIGNGSYGTCAKCGDRIALERLKARPIATRCIACA